MNRTAYWRTLVLALAGLLTAHAVAQIFDEYQIKAAFICKLPNFVEWPRTAFRNSGDPFSICVLGRNPFGPVLGSMAEGKDWDGHAFRMVQISDPDQAKSCQILFISASEHLRFRSILQGLRTSNVLAIGDTNDFLVEGGVVNLRLDGGKVRIDINLQSAKEKDLRISSRLLELARLTK